MHASQPIGIFDSGIGGLTVAHDVAKYLPHEDFVYFGDLAHLPYGDKSAETIQRFCYQIVDFFLEQNCKCILIACNSAAAAAYQQIQQHLQNRTLLIAVIDPVVEYLANHMQQKTIGLIGTKRTINSEIFLRKISTLPNQLKLKSLATPLLVPIIEENFHLHEALVDQVLALYLSDPALADIESLILGCTHYPVIKTRIAAFYQHKIPLLDAGEITAQALKKLLQEHQLLNTQSALGQKQFYVSDLTPAFAQMANHFFGETIHLQVKQLGEV